MRLDGYSLRPWQAGDEQGFAPRADFAAEARAIAWRWADGPPGPTWTLLRRADVIAIGGGFARGGGVFDVWASVADGLRPREWLAAMMYAVGVIGVLRRHHGAKLVIASCRGDNHAARRCLERMGFIAAGVMRDERLPGVPLLYLQRSA